MQQIKLTPQQQQAFAERMSIELDRMTMSWDNELRDWHVVAIRALRYASLVSLNISLEDYQNLLKEDLHGISMKSVSILVNNLDARTPDEMDYRLKDWATVLMLNQNIAKAWNATIQPVQSKVIKEIEIMAGKPKMLIAEA